MLLKPKQICRVLCVICFLGIACIAPQTIENYNRTNFQVFAKGIIVEGKKCAVISGDTNTLEQIYAYTLTKALSESSTLSLITQEDVKKKFSDYPVKIKGPFGPSYFEVETDYTKTDVQRLAEIQKKLKTDYLIVVWTPSPVKRNSRVLITGVIQMFYFPEAREIARGTFNTSYNDANFIKEDDIMKNIVQSFNDSSKAVAKDLSTRLGITKIAY